MLQEYISQNPTSKLKDVVVKLLYDQVVNLELKPGSKLNINQLASNLGISRTPVAEAVMELMNIGLVVNKSGSSGYYVMELNMTDMIDLYRVRSAIECEAASLCTERANPEVIDRLEALAHDFEQCALARDNIGMTESDMPFHRLIVESSKDSYLIKCYDSLVPYLNMYQVSMVRAIAFDKENPWYPSVIYNHTAIVSAIKMHIPELAREAMESHVSASLNYSTYSKNNSLFQY